MILGTCPPEHFPDIGWLVCGQAGLDFGICDLEFDSWNLRLGICDLEFATWNLDFGI